MEQMFRKKAWVSLGGYAVALIAVAAAVVVRLLLDPLLGDRIPFLFQFAALVFVAWFGGRGPAFVALVASAVSVAYFHLEPQYSFAVAQIEYQIGLVLYVVVGLFSISVFDSIRQAQRQAAEQGERLRTTLASIGDGVITTDREGRITNLNTVAEALTGWKNEEAVGQPLDAIFRIVNEETRQPVANPATTALREGAIVALANHTLLIAKDGTERHIEDSAAPIKEQGGTLYGVVLVFRDISERRRAEEERAIQTRETGRRRRLYEAALSNTPDLVYVFDLAHRFTYANEGLLAMWGRTWDEAIGKNCLELGYEPWHAAMHDREIEQVVATKQPVKGEVPFTGTFGRRIYEYIFVPVLGVSGEVEAIAGTTRDVTDRRQAEEALRESEERFRQQAELHRVTLASIGDAVLTTDDEGRVTFLNEVAVALTGWKVCEAVGQPLDAVFHIVNEQTRQPVENPAWRALKEGMVVGLANHTVLIAKDGSERPIADSAAPIRTEAGRVAGVVLVFRDVTEQKRSEGVLTGQKRVLELLVQRAPLPDVLDAVCEIIEGQSQDNLVATILLLDEDGRRLRSVAGRRAPPSYAQAVDGVTIGPCVGSCGTAAYRGESVVVSDIATDPLWANFRDLALGHGLRACWSTPIFSSKGKVLGTIAVYYPSPRHPSSDEFRLVDILTRTAGIAIERRQAEGQIRASEERFRTLFESMDEAFCVVEMLYDDDNRPADYRFLEANPTFEKHTGFKDAVGRTIRELVPDHDAHWFEIYGRVAATGEATRFVNEAKAMGRWYDVYAYRVGGAESRKVGVLFTDITERKRAEDSLRQMAEALSEADHRKDEFLATLAHELRNPLAPIRNGLQVMRMVADDRNAIEQAQSMMDRQLSQLVRLVDDLMDVSRISRGKIELRKERVELAAVLNSALETSRPLIEQMGHEITVTLPKLPVVLEADDTRLAQVIMNLLNNAAKYTEQGGRIWLTAERQGGDVVVSVKDNGIGFAPNQLPLLFEMFSQLDHSLGRSQGGLGIGLTLVKRLVEMHGGRIEARSEGPGKGSEFIVRLPVVVETSQPQASSTNEERSAVQSSLRILVVDDNRDGADSLSMMLQMMGNDTRTAYDGEEAVAAIVEFRPDVVLLDIGLPKLTGYEACRRIRAQPGGKELVIIAQTGWGQEEDRQRTQEAGFDHHMVKPVDPTVLMKLLAELQAAKR
jgi:PAS domain S-box-containing protein